MSSKVKKAIRKTSKKQPIKVRVHSSIKKVSKKIQKTRSVSLATASKKLSSPIKSKTKEPNALQFVSPFQPYKLHKGEKYMSEEMKDHFRKLLLAWKKSLTAEMDETVNYIKEAPGNLPDLGDRASREEQFRLELRERDRDRRLIRKIDESLALIDSNNYGYCEMCGEEIGLRRLEARPTATLCIDCKTLNEIKEKQGGG